MGNSKNIDASILALTPQCTQIENKTMTSYSRLYRTIYSRSFRFFNENHLKSAWQAEYMLSISR